MRKMPQKQLFIFVLFLAIALAFSGCGRKSEPVTENGGENNQPSEPVKTGYEIIEPEKTDCANELDTSCWKTFMDYDYKVKINYPQKLLFNKWGSERFIENIYRIYFLDDFDYGFSMRMEKNKENINLSNFSEWKNSASEIQPQKKNRIGKYEGIIVIERDGIESIGYYFYTFHDDKMIIFRTDYTKQDMTIDKKIFEKVIESLKLF
ncbi:MAG: hypothetical protein V1891_02490 [bacterium]